MGLTCNFYSKLELFFEKKKSRFFFLPLFTDFKLLMFHNNILKISELLNKWNLLKTCIQSTYLSIFANFAAIFTKGKIGIFSNFFFFFFFFFFWNTELNKTFCA